MPVDARPASAAAWLTLWIVNNTSREPWAACSALRAIMTAVVFCSYTAATMSPIILFISPIVPLMFCGDHQLRLPLGGVGGGIHLIGVPVQVHRRARYGADDAQHLRLEGAGELVQGRLLLEGGAFLLPGQGLRSFPRFGRHSVE